MRPSWKSRSVGFLWQRLGASIKYELQRTSARASRKAVWKFRRRQGPPEAIFTIRTHTYDIDETESSYRQDRYQQIPFTLIQGLLRLARRSLISNPFQNSTHYIAPKRMFTVSRCTLKYHTIPYQNVLCI